MLYINTWMTLKTQDTLRQIVLRLLEILQTVDFMPPSNNRIFFKIFDEI